MSVIAVPKVIFARFGYCDNGINYLVYITPNPYINCIGIEPIYEDVVEKLIYSGLYTILNTGFRNGLVMSFTLLKTA